MDEQNEPRIELVRLARQDVQRMAAELQAGDVRSLVDLYYQVQHYRVATGNQRQAAAQSAEPAEAIRWAFDQLEATENDLRRLMDGYTDLQRPGRWAKSQVGIGPVLAAGCISAFRPDVPTVGQWWRFAGLDPTNEWLSKEKATELVGEVERLDGRRRLPPEELAVLVAGRLGRQTESFVRLAHTRAGLLNRASVIKAAARRPYSAFAKVLAWKIADSFVRQSGHDRAIYGRWYRERKEYEVARDLAGGNATTAAAVVASGRIKDAETRAVYADGHLPDGRLDLRARRWVAKLFLAHLHWVSYECATGQPPPAPYGIAILGHAHLIAPPGWPCD